MDYSPFSFRKTPPAVKWLIITNSVMFIFQQFFGLGLETYLSLIPFQTLWHFQLWRLFTYLFLHGSFFHILMNLFTLWMFGKELEYVWGTQEFIKFYFFCGLGAGLFNIVFEPFSLSSVLGASGAIYGLLVAFAMVFPESVIYLYAVFPMRAKHFVLLIGVMEFFSSFDGAHTTVARLAHLGGMLVGYLYLKSYEFRSLLNHLVRKILSLFVVRSNHREKTVRKPDDLVKEVDRILEKVLTQGVESLTSEEREIMRRYSSQKH